MEDMTSCTYLKYKQKNCSPSHQSLFLFVTSVARTNFEVELVQRGGSLCVTQPTTTPLTPKRDCIGKYVCSVRRDHLMSIKNATFHTVFLTFSCTFTRAGGACKSIDSLAGAAHLAAIIRNTCRVCPSTRHNTTRKGSTFASQRSNRTADTIYIVAALAFGSK